MSPDQIAYLKRNYEEWIDVTEDPRATFHDIKELLSALESAQDENNIRKACDKAMQITLGDYHARLDEARIELASVKRELEAAQADAERYKRLAAPAGGDRE